MQRPTHRQSEIESSMSSLVHSNRTIKNRNEEGGWTDTEGGNYKKLVTVFRNEVKHERYSTAFSEGGTDVKEFRRNGCLDV